MSARLHGRRISGRIWDHAQRHRRERWLNAYATAWCGGRPCWPGGEDAAVQALVVAAIRGRKARGEIVRVVLPSEVRK